MNKRISRRELKNRIHIQNLQIDQIKYAFEVEKKKRIEIQNRFRQIGSDPELVELHGIPCIEKEIELQPWGEYILTDDFRKDAIVAAEERLAGSIAKELMEANIIRFIVKGPDEYCVPFDRYGTVAAKLYCIPWEQVVTRKLKINFFRGGTEE